MNKVIAADTFTETLERVERHWDARRQAMAAAKTGPWSIALARQPGTGSSAVAQEVGKRLGWTVYDHELLQRIAADSGMRTHLLESVDEHRGSWLRETFEALMGVPFIGEAAYVHQLTKTVLALGALGHGIIVGRGAAFILPPLTTLRVYLVAPLDDRITHLSQQLGIDHATARTKTMALDKEMAGFVRDHFHRDPFAMDNYDLVLNAARFTAAECADLIVNALRMKGAV